MNLFNKILSHKYTIHKKIEVGLCLKGSEVKSIRNKHINFTLAYVCFKFSPVIKNININFKMSSNYKKLSGNREIQILMKNNEICRWRQLAAEPGYTVLVESINTTQRYIKADIVLVTSKTKKESKQHAIEKKYRKHKSLLWKEEF